MSCIVQGNMNKKFFILFIIILSRYNYVFCDTNQKNNIVEKEYTYETIYNIEKRSNKPRLYVSSFFFPGQFVVSNLFSTKNQELTKKNNEKVNMKLFENLYLISILLRSSFVLKIKIHKIFDAIIDIKILSFYSTSEIFSFNTGIEWYYYSKHILKKSEFYSMSFTIGTSLNKKNFITLDLTLLKYEKFAKGKCKLYIEFGTIRVMVPCKIKRLFQQILFNIFSFSIGCKI